MGDKREKKLKNALSWVIVISVIIILFMVALINSQNQRIKYYSENYDHACSDGTHKACIEDGKRHFAYGEDELFTICDTDRKERPICVDEGVYWNPCPEGSNQFCVKEGESFTSCSDSDYFAKCVKEDAYGILSSSGHISYCDAGELPGCFD